MAAARKIRVYLSELWVPGAQMAGPLPRLRHLELHAEEVTPSAPVPEVQLPPRRRAPQALITWKRPPRSAR